METAQLHKLSVLGDYISRDELARELGRHPRTLKRWAVERTGPPYVNIGRTVLYKRQSILAWLDAQAEQGAAA